MPVDYSKWDALELSDDSDIEVHPNVDKRSFIRAKQNQIHQQRQQRKLQIETYKYERIINDSLIKRISGLLSALKNHASEAKTKNPGEVAFQAVMESAAKLDPKDDQPPPRPDGVHNAEEKLPTYTKMMATLLDQVNKALDEKKVEGEKRYEAMIEEVGEHLKKVEDLQKQLEEKLAELEKEEARKITSEGIHTGFDSTIINKAATAGEDKKQESKVELLNPNFKATEALPAASSASGVEVDEDEELTASPTAKKFAQIKSTEYRESLAYLSTHPEILTEKDTDSILVLAFDAALEGKADYSRNCVHQALLIQYCRALGRDGVALFFKRITTKGHQAQEVFFKDVQETYMRIKNRAREINLERAKDAAEGKQEGVEQIQLQAVDPGTVINIRIPPKDSDDPEVQEGRKIFESFSPEFQRALETGKLEEVNKVLGRMGVEEAEELVGKLGESGVLSIEEEIIDATTEEGKDKIKQLEKEAEEAKYADDPE
ncbi:Cdc37 N terminal kinase binding-domain-containing protein [Podospora australis]|uniref:Hsp90 chaperone protein kinase-targeting subunit n=1 Tax=Podospora australis TaxID=1536484 RepID=A0AAN6X2G9_9PEZI|nr:Cdc37 N terminal kinase binding-domain-containing protein [Podospora australis]